MSGHESHPSKIVRRGDGKGRDDVGTHKFEAVRLTDAQVFEAFKKIAAALERDDGQVTVQLGERHGTVQHPLGTLDDYPTIQELLKADTAAACMLNLGLPWFRQHADEEFRLKRLELDIDRASWVVEMAMEWRDEKGFTIPEELIERLTRSLFVDRELADSPQHPYENLASALFDSVKSMRMAIPGIGEAELDRRALRRFRRASASRADND